uniref:Uncharacterized protein n=1 Tax=Lepeophtheirus salmonis TaxID=72036 RepID=A0A0K2V878_LEPSM
MDRCRVSVVSYNARNISFPQVLKNLCQHYFTWRLHSLGDGEARGNYFSSVNFHIYLPKFG